MEIQGYKFWTNINKGDFNVKLYENSFILYNSLYKTNIHIKIVDNATNTHGSRVDYLYALYVSNINSIDIERFLECKRISEYKLKRKMKIKNIINCI